jgi:hypothetical protein
MTTREHIEIDVCAVNTVLREKVSTMSLVELLCNCHPLHRGEWAYKLYREKQLTKEEASKFTKIL